MGLRRTMSNFKKNNKKSANKNRKNYKIESLEPRLMMDGEESSPMDKDWCEEVHSFDHLYDLMNAVGALKDNRIEGLYIARGESIEAELLRFYKSVKMYYRFHCVA